MSYQEEDFLQKTHFSGLLNFPIETILSLYRIHSSGQIFFSTEISPFLLSNDIFLQKKIHTFGMISFLEKKSHSSVLMFFFFLQEINHSSLQMVFFSIENNPFLRSTFFFLNTFHRFEIFFFKKNYSSLFISLFSIEKMHFSVLATFSIAKNSFLRSDDFVSR